MRRFQIITVLSALALMAGCESVHGEGRSDSIPATVNMADADTRAAVTAVLAKALHRKSVELGPTAAPATATITVLPPPPGPYEKNSPLMPIRFDIVREGGKCRAVREDTKEAFDLVGVECST